MSSGLMRLNSTTRICSIIPSRIRFTVSVFPLPPSSSSAKSSSGAAQSSSGTASSSSAAVTVTELSHDVSLPVSSVCAGAGFLRPGCREDLSASPYAQIPGCSGNGVLLYGESDGSPDSSSMAEAPGTGFSAAGAVTTYGGGAATVSRNWIGSAMVAKSGNYPDKVTVGSLHDPPGVAIWRKTGCSSLIR